MLWRIRYIENVEQGRMDCDIILNYEKDYELALFRNFNF